MIIEELLDDDDSEDEEILSDIDQVVFGLEHPKLVSIFEYRLERSVEMARERKVR